MITNSTHHRSRHTLTHKHTPVLQRIPKHTTSNTLLTLNMMITGYLI